MTTGCKCRFLAQECVDPRQIVKNLSDGLIHIQIARTTMPSEANRTCRIMWDFAGHFKSQMGQKHPLHGQSQDVVYLLVWSVLVLNADAHNPQVSSWFVSRCLNIAFVQDVACLLVWSTLFLNANAHNPQVIDFTCIRMCLDAYCFNLKPHLRVKS